MSQIQTKSLSKTGIKVIIAINGKTSGESGAYAVQGNRGSTDQHTLRVYGTIALKSGWTTSVKFHTHDYNWVAKISCSFSCHLLKSFSDCSTIQAAQARAHAFGVVNCISGISTPNENRVSRHVDNAIHIASTMIICVFSIYAMGMQIA